MSETAESVVVLEFARGAGADVDGGAPAKFSSPRPGIPRSMATLLTSVETPFGGESCASSGAGTCAEVFSRESLTDRESGMSEAAIKARWKEAIGSGGGGSRGWGEGERGGTICCNG